MLSWLDWNPTNTIDSHLNRVISTNCCVHTVVIPDDGLDTPETYRGWWNVPRISCASSWFFFTRRTNFSSIAPTVGHCSKVFPAWMLPLNNETGMKSCVPFHWVRVTAKPQQKRCHHRRLEKLCKLILICDRDDSWNGAFSRRYITTLRLRVRNVWVGGGKERPQFSTWNFKLYEFPIQDFCLVLPGNVYKFSISWELRSFGLLAASSGNSLPTFRDNISVPFSRVKNPRNNFKIRKFYIIPTVLFCDSYGSKSK